MQHHFKIYLCSIKEILESAQLFVGRMITIDLDFLFSLYIFSALMHENNINMSAFRICLKSGKKCFPYSSYCIWPTSLNVYATVYSTFWYKMDEYVKAII
jgi:hypothetical protein